MPLSINTNMGALQAQRATVGAERAQEVAMQRLATGVRLNSAADDAAGIAVAARMSNQVRGLDMALRNAQDGLSLARTADGAIEELQQILQRLRELAVQSANGTYADTERIALNAESAALLSEIRRISAHTRWDRELNLLDGSQTAVAVQAGMESGDTVVIPLESLTPLALGFTGIQTLTPTRPLNTFVDGHDGTFQVVTYQPPSYVGNFSLNVAGKTLTVNNAQTVDDVLSGLQSAATAQGLDNIFTLSKEDSRIKLTWVDSKGPKDRGTLTRTGELTYPGINTLGKTGTLQVQTFDTAFNRDYRLTVGTVVVSSSGATNLTELVQQLSSQLSQLSPAPGFTVSEDAGKLKLTWAETGPQVNSSLRDLTDQTLLTGTTTPGISGKQVQVFDTVYSDGTFSLTIDGNTYTVSGATSWADLANKFQSLPGFADLGFEILANSPGRGFKLVWKTDGPNVLGTVVRNGPYPYGASGANGILERTAVQTFDPGVYSGDFTLVANNPSFPSYQRSLSVTGATDRADLIAKLNAANAAAGGDPLFTLTDTPPSITLTWNAIGFRPQVTLTRDAETRSTGNAYTGNTTSWAVQKWAIAPSAYGLGQDVEFSAGSKTVLIEDATSLDNLITQLNDPEILKDLPAGIGFFRDENQLVAVWDDATNQAPLDLKINGDTLRILTVSEALTALPLIDSAAEKVHAVRAGLGAAGNRIEYLVGNLLNLSENTRAARSTLEDADYAAESAQLAKSQILSEASTAMLAQANQSQQYVMTLLSER